MPVNFQEKSKNKLIGIILFIIIFTLMGVVGINTLKSSSENNEQSLTNLESSIKMHQTKLSNLNKGKDELDILKNEVITQFAKIDGNLQLTLEHEAKINKAMSEYTAEGIICHIEAENNSARTILEQMKPCFAQFSSASITEIKVLLSVKSQLFHLQAKKTASEAGKMIEQSGLK